MSILQENPQWSRQSPYKVPEGYFDTLTRQVMGKVDSTVCETPSNPPVAAVRRRFSVRWGWGIGIAAAAAVLAVWCLPVPRPSLAPQPDVPAVTAHQAQPAMAHATAREDRAADEMYEYMMLDECKLYEYADDEE